jgi:hypothetical protein
VIRVIWRRSVSPVEQMSLPSELPQAAKNGWPTETGKSLFWDKTIDSPMPPNNLRRTPNHLSGKRPDRSLHVPIGYQPSVCHHHADSTANMTVPSESSFACPFNYLRGDRFSFAVARGLPLLRVRDRYSRERLPSNAPGRSLIRNTRKRGNSPSERRSTTPNSDRALSRIRRKDWNLVQQAVRGDSRAQEELFATHSARLYWTAYAVVRNKEDAEDAVQNSLCNAFINLRSFKGRSSFSTWLTRIVINSALMIRRRKTVAEKLLMCKPRWTRWWMISQNGCGKELFTLDQILKNFVQPAKSMSCCQNTSVNFRQPFEMHFNSTF